MKNNSEFAQRMREKKAIEKEKLKTMGFREKVDYIWTYYRLPIVASVIILCLIVSFVHNIITMKDTLMYSMVINANTYDNAEEENDSSQPKLFQDYMNVKGYDLDKYQIDVNTTLMFDPAEDPAYSDTRSYSVLTTLMMSGTVDNVMADKNIFDALANSGFLASLTNYLTPEELEAQKDHLIYATDPETEETFPVGISLDDSAVVKNSTLFYNVPVIGFVYGAPHKKESVEFLQYMMAE